MLANPLASQCTARSKATGERCRHQVVGGGPCHMHGGKANQVAARRQERVAIAEARAAAGVESVVVQRAEPEELLLDLLDDVNRILQRIKSEMHESIVSPPLLAVAGEWFDRTARVAKTVIDGDLATKLHDRIGWLARDRADTVWGHLAAVVEASPLTAAQKLAVWESVGDGLRLIHDGRAPFRLSGDAVHRFSDRLQVEAAREAALAEGLSWGPESESDVLAEDVPLDGALL